MSASFPLRINWLPTSRAATIAIAERVEGLGFEGLGVCDSPRGIELYAAMEAALSVTRTLSVGSNVTNPSSRHWSVHASALRGMHEHGPDRTFLGFGTGDSAVRTHGGRPATVASLRQCVDAVRAAVGDAASLLVAASGPKAGAAALACADGVVAGVGTSGAALHSVVGAKPARAPFQRWATLRVAVASTADQLERLRAHVLPRAISAARFALGSTFEGKDVPEEHHDTLRQGFAGYDFGAHGRAGETANARLFADRPDLERYLLERFCIVDTAEGVRDRLHALAEDGFTGAYLSILFEDPLPELDRLAAALRGSDLIHARPAGRTRGTS